MGDRFPLCLERKGPLDRSQSKLQRNAISRQPGTHVNPALQRGKSTSHGAMPEKPVHKGSYPDTKILYSAVQLSIEPKLHLHMVFIHVLHTDPFLNFNLSLRVSLVQPSCVQLSYRQRHLASFTWCHFQLAFHSHQPLEKLTSSPWQIAQSFLFPMPTF